MPRSGMMAEYQSAVCHCAITAPSFRILQSGVAGHPALLTTKTEQDFSGMAGVFYLLLPTWSSSPAFVGNCSLYCPFRALGEVGGLWGKTFNSVHPQLSTGSVQALQQLEKET